MFSTQEYGFTLDMVFIGGVDEHFIRYDSYQISNLGYKKGERVNKINVMPVHLLGQAQAVLDEYPRPDSMVDEGNLFFAATEFKKECDLLRTQLAAVTKERDTFKKNNEYNNLLGVDYVKQILTLKAENEKLKAELAEAKEESAKIVAGELKRLRALVEKLFTTLDEVDTWIKNWNPNFADDDAWPETEEKVKSALAEAKRDAGIEKGDL